tara:strand:+ start:3633 stop:4202 length:570 start_codon:yes stop_codon:yes gene_type:complete
MKNNLIRIFDILISSILLIFSFPLMILISVAIYFADGRPVLFKQVRVGIDGKTFKILKFRTMKEKIIQNEPDRLFGLGKILRQLSFDEIPQFLNVLKNEMSIVGPRPLPQINEGKITKKLKEKRRKILPGITGLSQINYSGKYRKLDDKVKLDLIYVENYTLLNYFKIIIKTPLVLVVRLLRNRSSIIK